MQQRRSQTAISRRAFVRKLATSAFLTGTIKGMAQEKRVEPASNSLVQMPKQSAKASIESIKDIDSLEAALIKRHKQPGVMYLPPQKREPSQVNILLEPRKIRSHIHTHPVIGAIKTGRTGFEQTWHLPIPSPPDVQNLFNRNKPCSMNYAHIALINKSGKVVGYVSMGLTKKIIEKYEAKDPELMRLFLEGEEVVKSGSTARNQEWYDKLKKLGLKSRITPTEGYVYVYDEKYGHGRIQDREEFLKAVKEGEFGGIELVKKGNSFYTIKRKQ